MRIPVTNAGPSGPPCTSCRPRGSGTSGPGTTGRRAPFPLGATPRRGGTNFAVASGIAGRAGDKLAVGPHSVVVLRSPARTAASRARSSAGRDLDGDLAA